MQKVSNTEKNYPTPTLMTDMLANFHSLHTPLFVDIQAKINTSVHFSRDCIKRFKL
jgi:hypothetical protein